MKPRLHARSSAKKWGGEPEEYQKYHDWFDQTKSHHASVKHRTILHSSFGIFLSEQVFGTHFINSVGREVSTRDIGEQHVLEDLGFIPSVDDWLRPLPMEPWMGGPSRKTRTVNLNEPEPDDPSVSDDVPERVAPTPVPLVPYVPMPYVPMPYGPAVIGTPIDPHKVIVTD